MLSVEKAPKLQSFEASFEWTVASPKDSYDVYDACLYEFWAEEETATEFAS